MLADVLRTNWFANINMLLWPFVDKIVVIDASARDAGFKKYVAAVLASANGPEAIAALIDQRLGTLERARRRGCRTRDGFDSRNSRIRSRNRASAALQQTHGEKFARKLFPHCTGLR
jgi:hypothetical protein